MTEATVVLDKSFVQGATPADIQALCHGNLALMPDVLFFEMLSSEEPGRSRCFSKFPPTANPVMVIPNIGELLRFEFANRRGSGPPSAHAKEIHYRFNPNLARSDYKIPLDAQAILDAETGRLSGEVVSFVQLVNTAPQMFPDAFTGSSESRAKAKRQIEVELAAPESVIRLYSQLRVPPGADNPPRPSELDPSWTLFRSLQVKLFATLDLAFRYGAIPEFANSALHTRMEHYMLDAQYAMLGSLEGGLATRDKWMRDLYHRMCPSGVLM